MICCGHGLRERLLIVKVLGITQFEELCIFLVFPMVAFKNHQKNNGDIRRPNGDICQPNGDIRRPGFLHDFLKHTEMAKA